MADQYDVQDRRSEPAPAFLREDEAPSPRRGRPAPPPSEMDAPDEATTVGRKRLAQSLMLEEQGPGGILRVVAVLIVAFVAGFIFWASQTLINEVVVASGEVSPIGSVKHVQHLEGGIVKEIRIKEGDRVEKDQIILVLAPSTAIPERDQLKARLIGLQLEAEQLQAVATGKTVDLAGVEGRYEQLATIQAQVFQAKRKSMQAQIEVIERQIAQTRAESQLLKDQEESIEKQIELVSEQVGMRRELMRRGLQPKIVMLDNERELAQIKGQLAENKGQQRRIAEAVRELRSRAAEINARLTAEAAESLGKLNTEIAELHESIAQVEDRVDRLKIRSPVRGIVQNLKVVTEGGVVPAGETVAEIIPSDADLVVEARVTTGDIGFVYSGQQASVKVVTYDYTRYGEISGTISRISATTIEDEKGEAYYRAHILLDRNYVGDEPDRNLVLPGMTVLADIRTGEKTLAEYLLKPIYTAFNEAFRER